MLKSTKEGMNTEEKARAYDEALNWMRELYPGLHGATKEDAEHYFPELHESEDERIIQFFAELATDACGGPGQEYYEELGLNYDKVMAWLEKQKDHFRDDTKKVEQKPAQTDDEKEYIRTIKSIISDFIRDKKPEDVAYYQRIYDWLDGRHIEQKPAEKEITLNGFEKVLDSFLFDFVHSPIIDCEPKEYIKNHSAYLLKAAYKELNAQLKQDFFEAQQEGRREGYEAAMAEQNPAEWSEEDEINRQIAIGKFEGTEVALEWDIEQRVIEWLKSLRPVSKESLQPHWKPSNAQINYLGAAVIEAQRRHNESVNGFPRYRALKELYEQLLKL